MTTTRKLAFISALLLLSLPAIHQTARANQVIAQDNSNFFFDDPDSITITNAANYRSTITPDSIASAFLGSVVTPQTTQAQTIPLPLSLGGVTAQIDNKLVGLFAVAPAQVNFHVPAWVTPGKHQLIVTAGFGTPYPPRVFAVEFYVQSNAPSLYTFTNTGAGEAAAWYQQFGGLVLVSLFGNGVGVRIDPRPGFESTSGTVELIVQGRAYPAQFAGPCPGLIALQQFNFFIEADALPLNQAVNAKLRSCMPDSEGRLRCADSQVVALVRR